MMSIKVIIIIIIWNYHHYLQIFFAMNFFFEDLDFLFVQRKEM